jgi:hypothetical protein
MSLNDQGLPRHSRLHQPRPLQKGSDKQSDCPPNNVWIPRWTTGNNIKEQLDDYYRRNPVPATAAPAAIPLAPTTGIKDVLPHMSQNLLEVVENLHVAVSTDPDNTSDNEAVIQALQHALDQKMKK